MIKKYVLLPDLHYPHHNKKSVNAVFQFIEWFRPDGINLLGDALNMDAVDHWKLTKGAKKSMERKRLAKEYKEFDKDILTPLEQMISPDCEKVFMAGNHEDWANLVVEKLPQLETMVEPEIQLRLARRNWKWIPWINENHQRGMYQYGKLLVMHGQYVNKYHAQKTAESFSKSVAYCHSHDVQMVTKVHMDSVEDFHTAQSIGCLCNTSAEFLRGRMNRWVNAFGVLYVREDGNYNLYVPIIVNGEFVFEGRVFRG